MLVGTGSGFRSSQHDPHQPVQGSEARPVVPLHQAKGRGAEASQGRVGGCRGVCSRPGEGAEGRRTRESCAGSSSTWACRRSCRIDEPGCGRVKVPEGVRRVDAERGGGVNGYVRVVRSTEGRSKVRGRGSVPGLVDGIAACIAYPPTGRERTNPAMCHRSVVREGSRFTCPCLSPWPFRCAR